MSDDAYPLRPYQIPVIDACFNHVRYRDNKPGYAVAPGGSGKSVMIAKTAERIWDVLNRRVVILARNEKLLTQNRAKLSVRHQQLTGVYCAGLDSFDIEKEITIASIQSIAKLGDRFQNAVMLCDECHNISTNSDEETQYWQFFHAAKGCHIIGFTATPFRTGVGKLSWGEEIINIPLEPLFDSGYLVRPVNRVPITPDLGRVHVCMGEFVQGELEEVFTDPDLLFHTVKTILRYCEGGQRNHVMIFAQSIKHCNLIERALRENGITSVASVDGDTPKAELARILEDLNEGRLRYVINCQLLKEGIDVPSIDCVVVVRSTVSKTLWEQMLYRGTRPAPGKVDFLVLDMGGNFQRHGSLGSPSQETDSKPDTKREIGKICPCCEVFIGGKDVFQCGDCGYQFPGIAPRKVNHNKEPDFSSNSIYNPPSTTGDMEYMSVNRVEYLIHHNRTKNTKSIRVDYHNFYQKVSEWLSPFSDSEFARGKCWQFFGDRGRPDTRQMVEGLMTRMSQEQILELLLMECGHLKKPTKILVDKSEKWPRIKAYDYTKAEEKGGGCDTEGVGALLEDDEILF